MTIPIRSGPYKTFHSLKRHESYLEFEGSTITIPIRARPTDNSEWLTDEVVLKAFMRLEVFPAYVNGLGTREFQFVIRDWELYGTCGLLNKLFYGHPLGHPYAFDSKNPKRRGEGERLPAMLTFTVSNNYDKEGDPKDEILAPARELDIRNLTSHDLRSADDSGDGGLLYGVAGNSLFWEVREAGKGKLSLFLYRRPPSDSERIPSIDPERQHDSLLARVDDLPAQPGAEFKARFDLDRYRRGSNVVKAKGNAVISPLARPRTPIEIRWRLGEKPRPGRGRIRLVSPARSLCTSDQRPEVGRPVDSADFPARITYAINYHIHINRERFVEDQAGIAIAVGAQEIPPRDVTVAFDKPHIGRVLGKYLEFGPGHCTGMHTISEDEYQQGANICRYWRTIPLAATATATGGDSWPPAYDPDFAY